MAEGRYGVDPTRLKGQKSIVDHMVELRKRVAVGETGLRIGHTAIEGGDLTVRNGDNIVSETDGTVVLRLFGGGIPEIRFYPLGETDTHQASLLSFDFDTGSGADQAVQLCIEETGSLDQDGGKVLLTRTFAVLSHQPEVGEETYIWLNADPGVEEIVLIKGRWSDQYQYDVRQALYTGSFSFGSGFSNWTHTYLAPFATTICPIVGFMNSVDTAVAWSITAQSTSSFKVRWATGTDGKTINFWNFRI